MNKYLLSTLLGTGLLGLAKSKLSGSGAKRIEIGPFYNQYSIGANVTFKLKNKLVEPNTVINFDDVDMDKWRSIFASPKEVVNYFETQKRSEHIEVELHESIRTVDPNPLFHWKSIGADFDNEDGTPSVTEIPYHLYIGYLDIKIRMMIPYKSIITNGEIADLIEKEIKLYFKKLLAENPNFEVVERNEKEFYRSRLYQENDGWRESMNTRLSTNPDDKLFNMVTRTYNEIGIVKIPERPFFVVSSIFLQDCPFTIILKDELKKPDADEWDVKRWGKYGDIRDLYSTHRKKKSNIPKLRKV